MLSATNIVTQATDAIRQRIKKVRLASEANTLKIGLFGKLAALISLCIGQNDKLHLANAEGVQVTLVVGVGFDPAIFRLGA